MSVNFTLKPVTYDGDASTEGMPAGLVYLSAKLEASDEQYSGFVSGWMRPEARALMKAAPALLTALDELLAAELTQIPPYEAGKEAQDAWADRRAEARNNARKVIAEARGEV